MNTRMGWKETNQNRAFLYRWLSGMFARELGVEEIEAYRDGAGRDLLEGLGEDPVKGEFVSALLAVFDGAKSAADLRIDLAAAFGSLFLGAGRARSAPPYESFYRDERGRLYQQATQAMDDLLRRYDVHVGTDFKEPSDHVAVQLELMAVLAAGGAECAPDSAEAQDALKAQGDFLETHLLSWIPDFVEDCGSYDGSGFYAGVAGFLGSFLLDDRSFCQASLAGA